MPDAVQVKFARDRWLFRFGLRRADAIIVQTGVQRDLLKANYGRDADLIPNFMDAEPRELPEADRTQVLWVGRLRPNKRPLLFIELAKSLPTVRFTMIGPRTPGDAALYDTVEAAAAAVPNLDFTGFQPFEQVEKQFDRCRVLVSTSEMEGFPNVFLQAMRRGIPIVSFVDPDGMLAAGGLGRVVADEAELREAVLTLGQGGLAPAAPIRSYYARQFSPGSVSEKYRTLLQRLKD
jgi:glycosyltransferase involved in cell wall biosynthesis